MFCQDTFDPWRSTIMVHLPHLSKAQATGLALWSLGMVLARSCALTAVSTFLAEGLRQKDNTVRQRLREWCYEANAKRGKKRQEVHVETCFAPLLSWVLSWWSGTQLAIALDATTLGSRFVVLAISVLYRGCAIPVAWVVLEAGKKQAWRREWLRMLRQLRPAVPRGWTVIVLADRGLYARWLFRRIVRLGWHPFLRINNGGTFRPEGSPVYRPLRSLVPEVGTQWSGRGTAFKGRGRQLECTLLARWDAGHQDQWCKGGKPLGRHDFTNLPPIRHLCADVTPGFRGFRHHGSLFIESYATHGLYKNTRWSPLGITKSASCRHLNTTGR